MAAIGLVLLLGATPVSADGTFVRGDVNEDGLVSIADLTRLIGYTVFVAAAPICHDSADIDDDGQILITDAIWLISFLFGPDGSAPLPAPYPDPGTDPTPDSLPPCVTPYDEPNGSELPHVFFFSDSGTDDSGFAVAPGQGAVSVPIHVTTAQAVEGLTISLGYDPAQVDSLTLDFEEGIPADHNADLRISHVSPTFPGRVYGYIVMEIVPPFDEASFPPGEALLVGHAVLEPSASLPIGSIIEVNFETLPPTGDEPPIRNEMVFDGAGSIYPTTQPLSIPVAPLETIFIRGDVNRDQRIDISDAVSLLQFLYLGQTAGVTCFDACDTDDSGDLDLGDAITLLFSLFQAESTLHPAAPYPYQGVDPTPGDPLLCEEGGS